MSQLQVDLDLIHKYNVAGPRYTSYPPANRFSSEVGWPELAPEIIANNKTERDLSLYFHIPFCETLCWYCGCNTVITTDYKKSSTYLKYLDKEMTQMTSVINPKRSVVQLHFGGGTPTFLSPSELKLIGEMIHSHFRMDPKMEAGVEIDPRRLSREHIEALRGIGFNRASLGVQDFDPEVQKAVHRIQPVDMTSRVIDWIRELGFQSLNIDLIYGLPRQSVGSFEKTVDEILKLDPDRIALFSYAHVPWIKPAQKILEAGNLPSAEEKLQILKMAVEKLTANDRYVYIGMDHFAKPTDELAIAQRTHQLHRNFQGYSTHGGADIYAFGISGISQIENAYWQNEKELPKYYQALDAGKHPISKGYLVTEEDKIRRETIMRIMCDLSLDYSEIERRFGIKFEAFFRSEMDSLLPLERDALIHFTDNGFEVTPTGRLLIRNIAMRFDASSNAEAEKRYSKTI